MEQRDNDYGQLSVDIDFLVIGWVILAVALGYHSLAAEAIPGYAFGSKSDFDFLFIIPEHGSGLITKVYHHIIDKYERFYEVF